MSERIYGCYSFARGYSFPEEESLVQQARKGNLEAVINRLFRDGSEEAEMLAEDLFERFA